MCCDSHSPLRGQLRRERALRGWATRRANLARAGGVTNLPGVPDEVLTPFVVPDLVPEAEYVVWTPIRERETVKVG